MHNITDFRENDYFFNRIKYMSKKKRYVQNWERNISNDLVA